MNIHTTHAAEGLARRAFTIRDVERMVEAGVIDRSERFELIGGEIVPMSPKGIRHERLKIWLNQQLVKRLPDNYESAPETTFRLADETYLEPDFVIYPTVCGIEGLTAETCLLAIEVADSSLAYDLGRKAEIYAGFGIAELWVMDVNTLTTRVFRDYAGFGPADGRYQDVADILRQETLTALFDPSFTLSLSNYT